MGLLDDAREIFGADNLYDVLGVEKDCTADVIKSAYRKKTLLCHPDKAPPEKKDEATRKFQTLCKCFDILHDEEKRKIYDESGEVDDESVNSDRDWDMYWRNLFPKVTAKKINDFLKSYTGSDEEKEDLKRIYEKCEGDMNKICEYHISYRIDDEDRLCSLLKEMIAEGEIENYPAFSEETAASKRKRRKKFEAEARAAAKSAAQSGDGGGHDDLALLILGNQQKRASDSEKFIADLEAKYAPKAKRRSKAKK